MLPSLTCCCTSTNDQQSTFAPILPQARKYRKALLATIGPLLDRDKEPRLLTVAALMILTLNATCSGEDKDAKRYMKAGVRMAEALHLMGPQRYNLTQFGASSQEERSQLCYVAWGAFNFSTSV